MKLSKHKLKDLVEIVSSKRVFADSYQSEGIPFFRGKEISQLARGEQAEIDLYISQDVYEDVVARTGEVSPGDILLTAVGTLGNAYRVKASDLPFYFKDGNVVWLRMFAPNVNSEYLSYWLRSGYGRERMLASAIGSTQAALTITALQGLEIELPVLAYQTVATNLLSAIDLKIQTNKQLSKTLEDIAQTIFKSWFIDFDPVKAKMAGEKPVGMDAATAALFPDSMEDSELGLIPKGWDIKNISSLGKVVTGKTPSTKKAEYWGIDIPFVTIPDMHGNLLITTTSRSLSKAGADSQRNQYVARGSAMVSCIATPGLVSYATTDCQTNQQINSVIPTDGNDGAWLFWHLRAMIPSLIRNSGVGTVFANLNKSDFSNILSIIPPRNLIHSFSKIGETVLEEMKSLSLEAIHLVSIRDSLLPRLISGELQIPEEMLAS